MMVGREGIEPPQSKTADLQSAELTTCSTCPRWEAEYTDASGGRSPGWSRRRESNHPTAYAASPAVSADRCAALPLSSVRWSPVDCGSRGCRASLPVCVYAKVIGRPESPASIQSPTCGSASRDSNRVSDAAETQVGTSVLAKTCHARADFATRLRRTYTFSPKR